eukprot:8380247-Pyramimonas_sp.AAC.1
MLAQGRSPRGISRARAQEDSKILETRQDLECRPFGRLFFQPGSDLTNDLWRARCIERHGAALYT